MAIYKALKSYKSGAVIRVRDIEQAQDFYSVERAIHQKKKAPGKCAGYYYMDISENESAEEMSQNNDTKTKRKNFSKKERIIIYRKT